MSRGDRGPFGMGRPLRDLRVNGFGMGAYSAGLGESKGASSTMTEGRRGVSRKSLEQMFGILGG